LLSVVGWLATSHTVRYALPLAALIAALAAAGLARLTPRPASIAAGLLAVPVLHGAIGLASFVFGTLDMGSLWAGSHGREEWRHLVTVNDPLPAYRRCEVLLPADARVLVVGEGRAWGCPRPHHVSSPYDQQLVQEVVESAVTADEAARRLEGERFTHLLIGWDEIARLGGPNYANLRWRDGASASRWRELLARFTVPCFREGGAEVRALVGAGKSDR